MRIIILVLTVYLALIGTTCANVTNGIQKSPSAAWHVLVNVLTDAFSSIKKHIEEDEEIEPDFVQPYIWSLIGKMIPVFEKEIVDPMPDDDVGRTILKTVVRVLPSIMKQAEKMLDDYKEVRSRRPPNQFRRPPNQFRRPPNQFRQIKFLNEFNTAIIQALSGRTYVMPKKV